MVDVVVIEPFRLTNDAFELESQTFRNRAAPSILGGALNCDAIQLPRIEGMRDECTTGCRHDTLPLVSLIQPIAQIGRAVCPIHMQMVDHSAETPLEPHTGTKSPVVCKLLEPSRNKPFGIRCRPHRIGKPGVPLPPIFPVGINQFEKLVSVPALDQTQLGLLINPVEKRWSPRASRR